MSNPPATRPPVEQFRLTALPPVRPLAIGAVAVVVGAVLLVLAASAELSVVLAVLGAVLMLLGLALAVAALVLRARLRTEVRLEPDAVTIVRAGHRRSLAWTEIQQVTLQHPRLTLVAAEPEQSLVVVNPRAEGDRGFRALQDSVRRRLDADRGYGAPEEAELA